MKKGLGYEKNFQYKGQMINYYNKVRQNPNIESCYCYIGENGYTCFYTYKKKMKKELDK